MSVFSRPALEDSSLADLHEIAKELGLEGFRRLRKADLIDALLAGSNGGTPADDLVAESNDDDAAAPRRARRGGRGRARRDADPDGATSDAPKAAADDAAPSAGRGRGRQKADPGDGDGDRPTRAPRRERAPESDAGEERLLTGSVELSSNGSGFVRAKTGEASDGDAYISAAQVRRCELSNGDIVAGPVRAPRRSERHPSLVRVDTVNGKPVGEITEGGRFDDVPATFPTERFALGIEEPTLKAIEWLTPLGHGSRATIVGAARAGKTEALRRLGVALRAHEDLQVSVVLAGVRPEEIGDWTAAGLEPSAVQILGASAESVAQAADQVVQAARRIASGGGDAVVLIDGLDAFSPAGARKLLASARNLANSGSLTIIATASAPVGGETTVIALDVLLTSTGRFPALDLAASGTIRPELLVGDAGAQAIAQARASAIGAA